MKSKQKLQMNNIQEQEYLSTIESRILRLEMKTFLILIF